MLAPAVVLPLEVVPDGVAPPDELLLDVVDPPDGAGAAVEPAVPVDVVLPVGAVLPDVVVPAG